MKPRISFAVALLTLALGAWPATVHAQMVQMTGIERYAFDVGTGVTPLLGIANNELSTGWNVTGGGGVRIDRRVAVNLQVLYSGLGVQTSVLNTFGVPGAHAHLWGFTLDPEVRFRLDHTVGFYLIGGGGYYWRTINLTRPTLRPAVVFDPFFGYSIPTLIPANAIIGSVTRVGWGPNVGAGVTFRVGDGSTRLFAEVRYHYIATSPDATQIIPVTFGVRW